MKNLESISDALGHEAREQLVIDLSCRKRDNSWFVAMNKWQTLTNFEINKGT
jgi:phosphoribosylformimino-5-aminoimidazole carboxamide ribotide isomerase